MRVTVSTGQSHGRCVIRPTLSVLCFHAPGWPSCLDPLLHHCPSPGCLRPPSRPSRDHPSAVMHMQLFSPSLLSTCPNQFHLLRRNLEAYVTVVDLYNFITHFLFYYLLLRLILSIRLRHWCWKVFSFLSSVGFGFTSDWFRKWFLYLITCNFRGTLISRI